jgi:Tol biopolymer transport system component
VSASSDGNLAFSLGGESEGRLIWHDRSGKALESLPASAAGISPALSPDERLVVVSRGSRFGSELWVTDLQRKTSVRMQYPQRVAALPVWSPDGAHLAFGCSGEMCEGDSSGGGQVRELSKISSWPQQYTADGRKLLYVNVARRSLELLTLDGSGKVEEVAPPGPTYFPASFAPGGGFLSYTSDESGKPEVYVRAVAPGTGKWAISNGGGGMAAWRSDGKELFYLTPDLQMMAVDVRLSPTFQAGTPKPLFKADTLSLISGRNNYVVSRDGQRFLIYRPLAESDTDPVHVVLHWPALLGKDTAVR